MTDIDKKFCIFDARIWITQKWFAIAHENRRNEGYARLPSKWIEWAVRANRMHIQGVDEHPQKNLAFLTSESGSLKNLFARAHENH